MATNKNQHYVPRCYLRPFTKDAGNAAISLFNIDRERLIVDAPVKNQCSGDYFYGEDPQLEALLQLMEREYAAQLRAIQAPRYALNDEERTKLKLFWQLQYLRTEAASQLFVRITEEMAARGGPGLDALRLRLREAVILAMRTFANLIGTLDDLKLCLVRNRSPVPFVTSDEPAVMTNRWYLADPRADPSSFGLGAAGCLILLPLTPNIMCVGYDGDVYSIPHTDGWSEIRRAADAIALNQHQFLNCRANIFLRNTESLESVRTQWAAARPHRPAQRHQLLFARQDEVQEGIVRYAVERDFAPSEEGNALVVMRPLRPKPTSWPTIIHWKTKGKVYTNGSAAGYVRASHTRQDVVRDFWEEPARPR